VGAGLASVVWRRDCFALEAESEGWISGRLISVQPSESFELEKPSLVVGEWTDPLREEALSRSAYTTTLSDPERPDPELTVYVELEKSSQLLFPTHCTPGNKRQT
jgi:hypothetical protein